MHGAPGGILFDKDGTLIDFHATWGPAYRAAAGAVAASAPGAVSPGRLLAIGGYRGAGEALEPGSVLACGSNLDIAALWSGAAGIADVAGLTALVESVFAREVPRSAAPVTDLAGLFSRLRGRGLALGVATMDSEALARDTLRGLGVLDRLDFLCGYDSGHGVKPHAGMVRAFCAATGLAPAAVATVGDTPHDLRMGRAAGAGLVVGVLSGASSRAVLAPLADRVIDDVGGLEALLDDVAAAESPGPGAGQPPR